VRPPLEHYPELLEAYKKTNATLTEYGGKIVLGRDGGMRYEFETEEKRIAYQNHITDDFWKDTYKKTGCTTPAEVIQFLNKHSNGE